MLCSLSPLMATFSALMTMTKSPPSTLGANVGLCLPRSRVAAATARRPSTTSVASMTYHDLVVSPALGAYVGTALTFFSFSGGSRCDPGAGQACAVGVVSATDIDPSPGVPARQRSSLPMRIPAGQNWRGPNCRPRGGRRRPPRRRRRDRVSQFDQNLVERGGRLVPLQLLGLVGSGRLPGPQLLQRRDLRPQLLERGVRRAEVV